MFNDSKYTKIYNSLMESRKTRLNYEGYVERHHIIPRCFGGSDEPENIVCLTAREHYVAHYLLIKMTDGDNKRKMAFALHMLSSNWSAKDLLGSRRYEVARIENYRALKGRKLSDTHKMRISLAHKGKVKTEKHKNKLSECAKTRIGDKNPFYGKTHSAEMKEKIRSINVGSRWYNNGSETKCFRANEDIPVDWKPGRLKGGFQSIPKKKCPSCGIEIVPANFGRHYTKCSASLPSDSTISTDRSHK